MARYKAAVQRDNTTPITRQSNRRTGVALSMNRSTLRMEALHNSSEGAADFRIFESRGALPEVTLKNRDEQHAPDTLAMVYCPHSGRLKIDGLCVKHIDVGALDRAGNFTGPSRRIVVASLPGLAPSAPVAVAPEPEASQPEPEPEITRESIEQADQMAKAEALALRMLGG